MEQVFALARYAEASAEVFPVDGVRWPVRWPTAGRPPSPSRNRWCGVRGNGRRGGVASQSPLPRLSSSGRWATNRNSRRSRSVRGAAPVHRCTRAFLRFGPSAYSGLPSQTSGGTMMNSRRKSSTPKARCNCLPVVPIISEVHPRPDGLALVHVRQRAGLVCLAHPDRPADGGQAGVRTVGLWRDHCRRTAGERFRNAPLSEKRPGQALSTAGSLSSFNSAADGLVPP